MEAETDVRTSALFYRQTHKIMFRGEGEKERDTNAKMVKIKERGKKEVETDSEYDTKKKNEKTL